MREQRRAAAGEAEQSKAEQSRAEQGKKASHHTRRGAEVVVRRGVAWAGEGEARQVWGGAAFWFCR